MLMLMLCAASKGHVWVCHLTEAGVKGFVSMECAAARDDVEACDLCVTDWEDQKSYFFSIILKTPDT